MTDPGQVEPTPALFPAPRWARVAAFVGLYAFVLAGMNELEESVVALLGFAGVDGSPLKGLGTMAGLSIGILAMLSLLYAPRTDRNEAIYATACILVTAILAFGAATATLIAIRAIEPNMLETTFGSVVPFVAGGIALVVGVLVTKLATRRRERMAGEAVTPADAPPYSLNRMYIAMSGRK